MDKQLHFNYYEAVIQLRPETEEIMIFLRSQIRKRNDVKITKITKVKNGLDVYITSQRFARALAKKMKRTFKGELKLTYSLHTRDRQTSRDKYRATVLFRPQQQTI